MNQPELKPLIPNKLLVERKGIPIDRLKQEHITAIVDLTDDPAEKKRTEDERLKYLGGVKFKIANNYQPIPTDVLCRITNEINRLISQGHYVYLHCEAALGRSPTVAAAYLIRYLNKTKKEAMDEVRRVRPKAWIPPDDGFARNLQEFETKCHMKRISGGGQ